MASRQSRLEAEKLAIIQQSMTRGRSTSPRGGSHSRSSSLNREDFNKELKWSIVNHDPWRGLSNPTSNKLIMISGKTKSVKRNI